MSAPRGIDGAQLDAPGIVRLGIGERVGMRSRALVELVREADRCATQLRAWWIVPALVVLLIAALAVATAQSAVPIVVYTLV